MNAEEITKALGGRWFGSYGTASCPAHQDRRPSFVIREKDGRTLWYCCAGCGKAEVVDAMRVAGVLPASSGVSAARTRRKRLHPKPKPRGLSPADLQRRELGYRILQEGDPIKDTLAERYLRQCRGIDIPLPPLLRFHPNCKHSPSGRYLPALLAPIQSLDGRFQSVLRVYLARDGSGKADVEPQKMALGLLEDGAVQLAPAGERLALAEGIETALSFQQLSHVPTWALFGLRYARVALPRQVKSVVIAADNGKAGEGTARRGAEVIAATGRRVELRFPPVEGNNSDWNDHLQAANGRTA